MLLRADVTPLVQNISHVSCKEFVLGSHGKLVFFLRTVDAIQSCDVFSFSVPSNELCVMPFSGLHCVVVSPDYEEILSVMFCVRWTASVSGEVPVPVGVSWCIKRMGDVAS